MKVTVRLTVLKDKSHIQTPHFSTPAAKDDESGGFYCTTGVGPGTVLFFHFLPLDHLSPRGPRILIDLDGL